MNPAMRALKHHVSGAVERGEADAVTEIVPTRADFEKVSEVYAEIRKPKGPVPMRSDWHFYR